MNELTLALYAAGLSNPTIEFAHLVDLGDYSYWCTIGSVDFDGMCTVDGQPWSISTPNNDTIDNELRAAFRQLTQLLN